MKATHSPAYLKQRKFLLLVPLLVVPFVVIIFAVLGGGKGATETKGVKSHPGFNLQLPDPHFSKDKGLSKLSLYEASGKDSDRIKSIMRKDPYYQPGPVHNETPAKSMQLQSILERSAAAFHQQDFSGVNSTIDNPTRKTFVDPNEEKVMSRLAQLKAVLKEQSQNKPVSYHRFSPQDDNPDMERIQHLVNMAKTNPLPASDPELNQISGMLDKIMAIQHPATVADSAIKDPSRNKIRAYAVSTKPGNDSLSAQGFYGLTMDTDNRKMSANTIAAIIADDQTLVSGDVLKLRLLQDIYIHGAHISKDQLVYGTTSLSNERLRIIIPSIRLNDQILPVDLEVYDMDGLSGVYIPGSINRDVGKQSADEALSGASLINADPSLGAQAASAGIQAARTLIGKKIRLARVHIKAGYQVLLKDNSSK